MRILKRNKVINTPLTPDVGSTFTGEVVERRDARGRNEVLFVHRELRPQHERWALRPQRDDDGKVIRHDSIRGPRSGKEATELYVVIPDFIPETDEDGNWLRDADGQLILTDTPNPDAYREYVMEDDGAGQVRKNFNFRPDPATVERRKLAARKQAILDELVAERLEADGGAPGEPADAGTVETRQLAPGEPHLVQNGRWWNVYRDDMPLSETGMTKEQAEALLASMTGPVTVSE